MLKANVLIVNRSEATVVVDVDVDEKVREI